MVHCDSKKKKKKNIIKPLWFGTRAWDESDQLTLVANYIATNYIASFPDAEGATSQELWPIGSHWGLLRARSGLGLSNTQVTMIKQLNPGRRPIFIHTIDQAKKISSPLCGPPF